MDIKKDYQEKSLNNAELRPLLEWQVQKKSQANAYFQLGALIFLLIVVGFLFWQKNYFGSITILMVVFLIFISQQGKEEIYCAVLKKGIRVKNELFPWENLESFWIFEDTSEIYLKTKKAFVQNVPIPINAEDAEKIRDLLIDSLPEKEVERSLSEIIIKKLGL